LGTAEPLIMGVLFGEAGVSTLGGERERAVVGKLTRKISNCAPGLDSLDYDSSAARDGFSCSNRRSSARRTARYGRDRGASSQTPSPPKRLDRDPETPGEGPRYVRPSLGPLQDRRSTIQRSRGLCRWQVRPQITSSPTPVSSRWCWLDKVQCILLVRVRQQRSDQRHIDRTPQQRRQSTGRAAPVGSDLASRVMSPGKHPPEGAQNGR
jgi:hypothetical protein